MMTEIVWEENETRDVRACSPHNQRKQCAKAHISVLWERAKLPHPRMLWNEATPDYKACSRLPADIHVYIARWELAVTRKVAVGCRLLCGHRLSLL